MDLGLAFGIGAGIGLSVLFLRRHVPESPRWLITHSRKDEAEKIVADIERKVAHDRPEKLPAAEGVIRLRKQDKTLWREIWNAMARKHRRRSILAFSLMVTQAFFYNAVLFTYGLVLLPYYKIPAQNLRLLSHPACRRKFLRTASDRPVIRHDRAAQNHRRHAYPVGAMLAVTAWMFQQDMLTAKTQEVAWSLILFVASSAASSADLTVSEVFPLEIRAFAIAIFYACGHALFGWLVGTGSRNLLFYGYLAGAVLMVAGGFTEVFLGVDAERKSLEEIASPLSFSPSSATPAEVKS